MQQFQESVLEMLGIELVSSVPSDETYIFFGEEVWFTPALLDAMLKALPSGKYNLSEVRGCLCCEDEAWNEHMASILTEDGRIRLGICSGPLPDDLQELPDWTLDWELADGQPLDVHSKMEHALRPMRQGAKMAFAVQHWVDVIRVNQLAIMEKVHRVKWQWSQKSWLGKLSYIFKMIWKVRSFNRHTIVRRLGEEGRNCKIHPTAVVEACEIGDNVEIGPYAVVRASVIGNGAKIEEHATVNLCSIGENARVARYAMVNLCVLMKDAFLSRGGGFQMCLLGQGAFVAVDAVMLDLSFGKTIRVLDNDGAWLDSKQHFLGVCIGHRAAIGNAVRLNYGVRVPNDSLLVANADELITTCEGAEPNIPVRVNSEHGVSPIRKKQT